MGIADRKKNSKVIIYLYNQFLDPVIQSNIYLYIRHIAQERNAKYQFALITFETDDTLEQKIKIAQLKNDLLGLNIKWYPLRWHSGTTLWLKLIDLINSFRTVFLLRFTGFRHIISLASVAGSYAYLMSLALGLRLYLYQYEPHSEYELDAGTYTKKSLNYILLNFLERKSAMYASVISSGTRHMMERLNSWHTSAELFKIPSVVNDSKFTFSMYDRQTTRHRHGISPDKIVLYYPGKFGGLYYRHEAIDVFSVLLSKNEKFHALVVTPNDLTEIEAYFKARKVDSERFTVTSASFEDIHKYHSAADFALISVPPGPSKKFVSNIKVGEYLCSGLPYLICEGVSEDDEYAERYEVGVVVKNFSVECIEEAYNKIIKILDSPIETRRDHCRRIGIDYRGFGKLSKEFGKAFDFLLSC